MAIESAQQDVPPPGIECQKLALRVLNLELVWRQLGLVAELQADGSDDRIQILGGERTEAAHQAGLGSVATSSIKASHHTSISASRASSAAMAA
jgi:hypothetical protein